MGAKVSYETANNSVSIDKKVEKISRKGARAQREMRWEMGVRSWEIRDGRQETGDWRLEVGGRKWELGDESWEMKLLAVFKLLKEVLSDEVCDATMLNSSNTDRLIKTFFFYCSNFGVGN